MLVDYRSGLGRRNRRNAEVGQVFSAADGDIRELFRVYQLDQYSKMYPKNNGSTFPKAALAACQTRSFVAIAIGLEFLSVCIPPELEAEGKTRFEVAIVALNSYLLILKDQLAKLKQWMDLIEWQP